MEELISTEDAARFLGVTRPTVIKYIQEERLEAMRTGKAYKITKEDLKRFAESIGMSESRLTSLETFLMKRNKKTSALVVPGSPDSLLLNEPSLPIAKDLDVLYFLSVRTNGEGHELLIRVKTPKFFIGRHSLASLSIQDPYVSTIHAMLLYQDEMVQVLDQSTNGTRLNGQVLAYSESRLLGDGDQFMVGTTVLSLIAPGRVDLYLGSDLSAREYHRSRASQNGMGG